MRPSDNRTTWIEISRSALQHNVAVCKRLLGKRHLFGVVKSNAYGHGTDAIISVIRTMPELTGFMVASLDEALALAPTIRKPISILSIWQHDPELIQAAVRRNIVFPVYDLRQANYLNSLARRMRKHIRVHLKIDVGTSRLGFRWDDTASIRTALSFAHLRYGGVFSHFADSESPYSRFTKLQSRRFEQSVTLATKALRDASFVSHIACSAPVLYQEHLFDGARVGIALYGIWPSQAVYARVGSNVALRPILRWKTRIMQLKRVKAGETIGYGQSYRSKRSATLAVLPIGYGDGYDRSLSNRAQVIVKGRQCSVRGRICMNLTMVEIPARLGARVGDEVTLVGTERGSGVQIDDLARMANTISYEFVTRINSLIPRFVVS